MTITFEEHRVKAFVPDLANGGVFTEVPLVYRVDPLTHNSARIITGTKLQPSEKPDLSSLMGRVGFCPFCEDTIERATFPFPSWVAEGGRVSVGRARVVPNILAYSSYSSVGVYDPSRHFLDISDLTQGLVTDALLGMVIHARAVRAHEHSLRFSSINANYLPSSGSSLVHPHLQSSHDPVPLTMQRSIRSATAMWRESTGRRYFEELVEVESTGDRFVGTLGGFHWITPFAPVGFHEVWGILPEKADLTELDDHEVIALGDGVARVLSAYAGAHLSAFNFSLQGLGPDAAELGGSLVFRIVSRAPVEPYYRSDVTYFEKLASEAMIDMLPEEWAEVVSQYF